MEKWPAGHFSMGVNILSDSGSAEWPQNGPWWIRDEYHRPNMAMGNASGTDNGHLKNGNMMFQ